MFVVKVNRSGKRVILFPLPDRRKPAGADVPRAGDEILCALPDGGQAAFRVAKWAINVAKCEDGGKNCLSDLLRKWFGADAGVAGVAVHAYVAFERKGRTWTARPATKDGGAL